MSNTKNKRNWLRVKHLVFDLDDIQFFHLDNYKPNGSYQLRIQDHFKLHYINMSNKEEAVAYFDLLYKKVGAENIISTTNNKLIK